ncbi:MAG: hypothetical protein KJ060_04865, partial [Candidatus Hydrogenedentes bacterium]|nr:hypothetical protein [Candidatus Hydrogenedentota bacterium]
TRKRFAMISIPSNRSRFSNARLPPPCQSPPIRRSTKRWSLPIPISRIRRPGGPFWTGPAVRIAVADRLRRYPVWRRSPSWWYWARQARSGQSGMSEAKRRRTNLRRSTKKRPTRMNR